jgi:hypothetical protein
VVIKATENINYLKLVDRADNIFYFYKKDIRGVEAFDKEGIMEIRYTFELDLYQTIYRRMF